MNANVIIHPFEDKRRLRALLAAAAEKLIDAIDAIDGDPDFEPSLGAPSQPFYGWQTAVDWARGADDDREEQCEDEGAQCEGEGEQCDDEGCCHVVPFEENQTIHRP